jgi:choline dehydrogenase-like flavoprotein
MQIKENSKEYDVIIVGSGAGGGMATKVLSEAGLSVAIVEAGPFYDPANPDQMTQMKWPYGEISLTNRSQVRPLKDNNLCDVTCSPP